MATQMWTPRRRVGLLIVALALCCESSVGRAWKPYTHNLSALEAYNDAVDDGMVTIDGQQYAIADGLLAALRNWPQYYNAGVIGPDGFPDLTYGQSVIHPGSLEKSSNELATGEWLRRVLSKAQEAQNDGSYTATEKQQILAFAYGYLTHAAGDMWGHSFINDFAQGVFPGVKDILTSVSAASIAARHIIAEGYVGDATPYFDGNRDTRTELSDGDISDDSTPGFAYAAPNRFLYETLIAPGADTPSADRGPIIDFYLDLRGSLDELVPAVPPSVTASINAYNELAAAAAEINSSCDFDDAADVVDCPIALAKYGFASLDAFFSQIGAELADLAYDVLDAYVTAWRADIDTGLKNWGSFGLATSKGLFDAQTRRNLQNAECATANPDETSLLRAQCEAGIGMVDTVVASANPFINSFLLSMSGFPDQVGSIRSALSEITDFVDDVFDTLLMPFNPIKEVKATVTNEINDLIADAVTGVLGVDLRVLQDFATTPSRFLCVESVPIKLPVLGTVTLEMFATGAHDRLDGLIGLPPGDGHHVPDAPLPQECGPLTDEATLQLAAFRALRNTVTTAKLLMLDGPELNRVLSNTLGRSITTYQTKQNIMTQQFHTAYSWLRGIDGDHSWRRDGLPRFCDAGGTCVGDATPRPANLNGGAGSFPLWESCVMRNGFRTLYRDWESESGTFPAFGDDASADDNNDPEAPTNTLTRIGALFYTSGTNKFVGEDHGFSQSAVDLPAEKAFATTDLKLRRLVLFGGAGSYVPVNQNDAFTLGPSDGTYTIKLQSADPCHGWEDAFADATPPSSAVNESTYTYILDTTAPVISCVAPPFGREFDSDDQVTVDYAITDGALGSGVAASAATIDGYGALPGVVPTSDGAALNLSQFYPGTRTVAVTANDHLQHGSAAACTFSVHATAASLVTNVRDARTLGLITTDNVLKGLLDSLEAAQKAHQRGKHETEWNQLSAFINQVTAQTGKAIDPTLAARLIAFASDIIARGK